jgi:hypothetical protein
MKASSMTELRPVPFVWWILIVGGVGFAAGFFGPIEFNPEANQGPLVGILITGPGGALLGCVLWGLSRVLDFSSAVQRWMIALSSTVLGVGTMLFAFPEPALKGYGLDFQIERCETPAQGAEQALQSWDQRIAQVTWAAPRSGWRDQSLRLLLADSGSVLHGTLVRQNRVYEKRKPWNKGELFAKGWRMLNEQNSYYVPGACTNYPVGTRTVYFAAYDMSVLNPGVKHEWPPIDPAGLLNRQTLETIPAVFQPLLLEDKPAL